MKRDLFQWRSLKTRVTLFTLGIFVISIWSLAYFVSGTLLADMERLLGEQQSSTASLIAAEIDNDLNDRLRALESMAARISPAMLGDPAALQAYLEDPPFLQHLFNNGALVVGPDGTTIADVPRSAGRLGVNYMNRDFIAAALKEGKTSISRPIVGKMLKAPLIGMVVPIRNAQGKVVGALDGVTELGKPNFLDKITQSGYGKTGGYILVAPQHRLIVTATDKSRIMEQLPALGVNAFVDRNLQGYEGSGVMVNARGVEVLSARKSIPAAGWYVAVTVPTAESFAAVGGMQQHILLATIFLTLIAGGLTWWMLRRQLSPMLAAAKTLASLSESNLPPEPLLIARQDEIGQLIGGFNRLLETLGQREAALKESEARFRSLTEMSSDFYWESDAEHRLTLRGSADSKVSAVSVFQRGAQIGERRWEIPHISPGEAGWRAHRADLDAHRPFRSFELSRLGVDGSERHISISGDPVFDASGVFKGYRGVGADITERKRAETELRTLSRAVEQSPSSIVITDRAGNVEYVNPKFEQVTGYTRAEAVGRNLRILKSGRTPAEIYADLWRAIAAGSEWRGELCNRRKNGELFWEHATISGLKDESGQVGHYVAVKEDITERKQAEMALHESEIRLSAVFHASPLAIVVRRLADGMILDVNAAALRQYGSTRDKMIGRTLAELGIYAIAAQRDELERRLRASGSIERFQMDFRNSKGEVIVVEVFGRLVELRSEQCLVAMMVDVTERKRAEEEKAMLEAQFQQAQKMDSVGRLAGGVAHDFNNMLTVILGNVAMAIEQVDPAHPIHTDLVEIRNAADRSADLTRQLLAFARKQVVAPKVLDLNQTVEDTIRMLQRLIGEDISLKWLPQANLWPVRMDTSQLDQILANLCINARDAIAGVGNIVIETRSSTIDEDYCAAHAGFVPGKYVRIAISDDGHGMDKETLAHIFEPFFTTKRAGEGTGLGLATVYGAVKQNDGFINVYSEPGTGTTFTIYLPRYEGGAGQEQGADATAPLVRGHETILVVEDEPSMLNLITRMLIRQGYAVLAAGSPKEAVRLAGEHASAIHLLMTDVIMPEMNGRDLAKNLLYLVSNLKVLYMSGYTSDIIAHQGVLDHGVRFIQKPFSMEELATVLREVLDSK